MPKADRAYSTSSPTVDAPRALTPTAFGEAPPPSGGGLRELLLVVRSSRARVEAGEASDFATAMEEVIVDLLTLSGSPPPSGGPAAAGSIYIGD